jgi:hypothetical protein
MHPIAFIQATETIRRGVRGSGPGDAVAERPGRRPARTPAQPAAPAVTVNLVSAQSGSDQCSIVAARRNPARA